MLTSEVTFSALYHLVYELEVMSNRVSVTGTSSGISWCLVHTDGVGSVLESENILLCIVVPMLPD